MCELCNILLELYNNIQLKQSIFVLYFRRLNFVIINLHQVIPALMVHKGHFKIILVFLFSLVITFSSQSQNRKYFNIIGKITSESYPIENCSVQIIKNDKSSINFQLPKQGGFRLELDYNAKYRLIFTQKGFSPKSVLVNTAFPQEALSRTSNYPTFLMNVRLFKDNQDLANLYEIKVIQQISYSSQQDCFARIPTMFDIEYAEEGNSTQNRSIRIK